MVLSLTCSSEPACRYISEGWPLRDDFPTSVRETLAKRVGYLCSNPNCGQMTSGPQEDPTRTINLGVAAHITAASPGGPRYDVSLPRDQRLSVDNGIWLCQTCAKLIDNDTERYSIAVLRGWKRSAEQRAARRLEKRSAISEDGLAKAERLMPELVAEIRNDLASYPLRREFVLLKKSWSYWAKATSSSTTSTITRSWQVRCRCSRSGADYGDYVQQREEVRDLGRLRRLAD